MIGGDRPFFGLNYRQVARQPHCSQKGCTLWEFAPLRAIPCKGHAEIGSQAGPIDARLDQTLDSPPLFFSDQATKEMARFHIFAPGACRQLASAFEGQV